MPNVLIIESRYYDDIATHLHEGAAAVLAAHDCSVDTVVVPGALEIPAALAMAVASDEKFDAYVLLGCVIRGETGHYDVVVNESARGIMDLVVGHRLAVGFGILTVENREQAMVRADPAKGNKGGEAAKACLAMIGVKARFASAAAEGQG